MGPSLLAMSACVLHKSNIIRNVDGSNQSDPLSKNFMSCVPFVGAKILLSCGWNVQLLLFVIYDAVLLSLNESPSISASSHEFANMFTIDM